MLKNIVLLILCGLVIVYQFPQKTNTSILLIILESICAGIFIANIFIEKKKPTDISEQEKS